MTVTTHIEQMPDFQAGPVIPESPEVAAAGVLKGARLAVSSELSHATTAVSGQEQSHISSEAPVLGSVALDGVGHREDQTIRSLKRLDTIAKTPGHKYRQTAGALHASYKSQLGL